MFSVFAVRTGLEPATLGVTGRYSNQLNYRTRLLRNAKVVNIIFYSKRISNYFGTTKKEK